MPRTVQVKLIRWMLPRAMRHRSVRREPYERLLEVLSNNTPPGYRHRFITTNWDYLLQEVLLKQPWEMLPAWLENSHVYHLNGTVEVLPDSSKRSPLLLESDGATQRVSTVEADIVYNKMIWDTLFVIVGMSFECQTDKFLLRTLGRVEDDLPIGESSWLVANRNPQTAEVIRQRIEQALPGAEVQTISIGFSEWIAAGLPEVVAVMK